MKEVRNAAIDGYAITFGERVEGSALISIPIMAGNRLIEVLSILGPHFRFNKQKLPT